MKDHFDAGSLIVIIVTFVLFVLALFTKGFTHDLLLEAGVLLVSIKLIMTGYKQSVAAKELMSEIKAIRNKLEEGDSRS